MSAKEFVLKAARAAGIGLAARKVTARDLRVLCYHGLWTTAGQHYGDRLFMPPAQFEARMRRLARSGRPVLPLGDAIARLAEDSLPEAAVVITIDDGWSSIYTHALPVLERYALPATLYVTTWYAGRDLPVVNVAVDYLLQQSGATDRDYRQTVNAVEALPLGERLAALRALGAELGIGEDWLECRQFHIMTPAQLGDAHRRGLDIQLHTHRHRNVNDNLDRLGEEIAENRAFLAQAIGGEARFEHFCYPSGRYRGDAGAVLAACGVRSATMTEQGINPPRTNPFALRRFVDGRSVGEASFDAYISGLLHFTDGVQAALRPRRGT